MYGKFQRFPMSIGSIVWGWFHIMTPFPIFIVHCLGVGFIYNDYNDPCFFWQGFSFNIWGRSQYQLRNTDHLRYQNGTKAFRGIKCDANNWWILEDFFLYHKFTPNKTCMMFGAVSWSVSWFCPSLWWFPTPKRLVKDPWMSYSELCHPLLNVRYKIPSYNFIEGWYS